MICVSPSTTEKIVKHVSAYHNATVLSWKEELKNAFSVILILINDLYFNGIYVGN